MAQLGTQTEGLKEFRSYLSVLDAEMYSKMGEYNSKVNALFKEYGLPEDLFDQLEDFRRQWEKCINDSSDIIHNQTLPRVNRWIEHFEQAMGR